jgi:DNA-directed RNA polymerase subunit RPC12/RpoP|tara:strand:+ start:949 stop:1206 length:258 start_codon:yes stop_codon:yes gene_type:complete
MSTKPMRPPLPNKQQVKVDISKADTVACESCNNVLFISSTIIKRISPLMSPTGEEALIPIDVYSCGNCGKVPKTMLKGTGLEDKL